MGCAASCLPETIMFRRQESNDIDRILARKLYIAKETPEPVFDLSECQLDEVPSGIYSLCKVYRKETLCLNNNGLISLEGGGNISDLYLLNVLNISCNNFNKLTSDIRYLENLSELYINNNQIQMLPEEIQFLINLKLLDISFNKLTQITPSLGKLSKLQRLNMKGNKCLTKLCPELCYARSIKLIELDENNFSYPPQEVVAQGTDTILRFFCKEMNVEYTQLSTTSDLVSSRDPIQNIFSKQHSFRWENQDADILEKENQYHEAAKLKRKMFLTNVMQDQYELDSEIAKLQEAKDKDRAKLIKQIQKEENEVENLVKILVQSVSLNPEHIQQQLLYEQAEHDHLLNIVKENYDNVKKTEVLKAMEDVIDNNFFISDQKKKYQNSIHSIKNNLLTQELQATEKLEQLFKAKDESKSALVEQLLEDQDVQKAMLASLVESVDAKTWSLNQEINLVSSNLAKLSQIEQEKKKLNISYNYNELLQHRTHLIWMLDDLFLQQNKRRTQLIETLKEIDKQKNSTDYWIKNYQRVIESAPKGLLGSGKSLDPLLATYLLQEGVIHCLPLLFKFLFGTESLLNITHDKLKANGVTLLKDREAILNAMSQYIASKSENHNCLVNSPFEASAPREQNIDVTGVVENRSNITETQQNECVICMDSNCEVAFVPCGHLCVCVSCSEEELDSCPMCRGDIERKIKIISV